MQISRRVSNGDSFRRKLENSQRYLETSRKKPDIPLFLHDWLFLIFSCFTCLFNGASINNADGRSAIKSVSAIYFELKLSTWAMAWCHLLSQVAPPPPILSIVVVVIVVIIVLLVMLLQNVNKLLLHSFGQNNFSTLLLPFFIQLCDLLFTISSQFFSTPRCRFGHNGKVK